MRILKTFLANVLCYIFCCVIAVPIGSTLLFVGSGLYIALTKGDLWGLSPGILIFSIFASTLFAYFSFGFYPADFRGIDTVNLWPWILMGGFVLYFISKLIIFRTKRQKK